MSSSESQVTRHTSKGGGVPADTPVAASSAGQDPLKTQDSQLNTRPTQDLLASIVGAEHVHEATPADAIDGVQPSLVVEPGTVEEASEVLRLANERGLAPARRFQAVAPRGGGTKLGWGNPPERLDLVLSTRRLNRVLEHAAGDLVVRVEAGARLEDVQRELAKAGQWLALDPPHKGATIGGIIAANASGPHRLRYGTARDLLIGLTYILPDGTVARSGGKVVKNVAGYDLGKLFTGSLGTLGLIGEAIFRLHPLPQASEFVVWGGGPERIDEAGITVQSILRSAIVPSALEYRWTGTQSMLLLAIDGVQPGVEAQREIARALVEEQADWCVYPTREALSQPRRVVKGSLNPPPVPAGAVHLKLRHTVTDLPAVVRLVRDTAESCNVAATIHAHAASGISRVVLGPLENGEAAYVAAIQKMREDMAARGGSAVVLEAPLAVKQTIDVWGDAGNALPLMRRVKARFDPNRIMNPGRFIGGI